MTTSELPYTQTLRKLYDEGVAKLNPERGYKLTTAFPASVGDVIFKAICMALQDNATDTHRMLTVPSPCGSYKTSYSLAGVYAVARLAECDPTAPYGVVWLVEQKEQAETAYRELIKLLPGRVRCWTEDHDSPERKSDKTKVHNPAARCSKEDLVDAPVAITTHAFFLNSKNSHLARTVVRNGGTRQRALVIVHERPDEAPTQSITLGDAEKCREAVVERNPEIKPHMDALFLIMEQCSYGPKNQLLRPGKELPWSDVQRDLWWFKSREAEREAFANAKVPGASAFFNFAKAFVLGRGFAATDGLQVTFHAYANQTVVDKAAGTILLDATANLDGRNKIVPWIVEIPTPQASFSNLEIVVIPPLEKTQLRKYFGKVSNRRAYVNKIQEAIRQHTAPGEKVLVVCRLALFENKNVPWWPILLKKSVVEKAKGH
jgi:hypothetical protein